MSICVWDRAEATERGRLDSGSTHSSRIPRGYRSGGRRWRRVTAVCSSQPTASRWGSEGRGRGVGGGRRRRRGWGRGGGGSCSTSRLVAIGRRHCGKLWFGLASPWFGCSSQAEPKPIGYPKIICISLFVWATLGNGGSSFLSTSTSGSPSKYDVDSYDSHMSNI